MQLLLVLHVFANMVWIGSIAAVGWITAAACSASKGEADTATIAGTALQLYRRAAVPAFVVSFLAGFGRLLLAPEAYMSLHWMHGKLTAAVVVIALHHVIGGRAKKVASGSRQAGRSSAILTGAILAFAFVTVTFALLKGQLVP
jgi:protoporphyrinogen IX oxidase